MVDELKVDFEASMQVGPLVDVETDWANDYDDEVSHHNI